MRRRITELRNAGVAYRVEIEQQDSSTTPIEEQCLRFVAERVAEMEEAVEEIERH